MTPPIVERVGLAELLSAAAANRICLIIATAGWGKTAAVNSWPLPTSWVRPARHDGDTEAFAGSVVDALRPHLPATMPDPRPPASSAGRAPLAYAAALCAWVRSTSGGHFALVLDDLHELPAGSGAARIAEGLCQHAGDRMHVVLLSRHEPPFSLNRLRGRGQVTELQAADLAFGLGETAKLLHATVGKCSPELIRQVWERTAGWPAATWGAVQMLRGVREDERIDQLDRLVRAGERFHGYLQEEVIGSESPAGQDMLRWVAVFGAVRSATAADTGVADAPALLADLRRRGLVSHVAGRRDRWALVRPLQSYFDQEPVLSAAERADLHRVAARTYADRRAFAKALQHAIVAGDHATCAQILLEHGAHLVNSGQVGTVLEAANLPPAHLDDPRIQQVVGQARQVRGQWASAEECFRRAGRHQNELDPALAWRLGVLAYNQADYHKVIELAESTRLASGGSADAVRLLALTGAARRMVGDIAGGRADAARAMAIAGRCAEPSALAAAHAARSLLAAAEGDRRRAGAHCAAALEAAHTAGDVLQELVIRVHLAVIQCELGRAREALAEADAAVQLGGRYGDVLLVAQARAARAAAQLKLGELDSAVDDFAAARDALQRIGSRLLAGSLCGLGDVYRTRGQLARARAAYEQALAVAEPGGGVLTIGSALIGLARVRVVDDPDAALALAERAVALGEGLRHVAALLTRGWVAAVTGDRASAAEDAASAAAVARQRRDDPGLAEALLLGAMTSADPAWRDRALTEAIHIWRETGHRPEEAAALLVASRVGADPSGACAELAIESLRSFGVELRPPRPAGPLAVLAGSAPPVSIQVLGSFQVIRDGTVVPRTEWQSRKARQLMKIVIARRGRPISRDRLMELLWPESEPAKAAANRLSVLLSGLRDILRPGAGGADHGESGPLITDATGVWLDYNQVDVDVERFLSSADAALQAHRGDQRDAMVRLVAAEAAHTGEFLEDEPTQPWASSLAEQVRATHVALLRALVQRHRRAGEVDDVVRYALRLLDKDGYDEQAHLDLVDVLQAAGRYGEARRRHRMYVRAMTELGVTPRPFAADPAGEARRSG